MFSGLKFVDGIRLDVRSNGCIDGQTRFLTELVTFQGANRVII